MSASLEFKGDYMGFTYGTKKDGTPMHSSDLGIVRVSNGSRFDENLLPTIQDKTVQIPGGDGTYYFGSYYTQRQFSVPFAFDSLTEEQFENLKRHFGDKQVHDLIFDEKPYKVYRAKVTGTATIKHVPFEVNGARIYKGEGTIQFTCYEPFARCFSTNLEDYGLEKIIGGFKKITPESEEPYWVSADEKYRWEPGIFCYEDTDNKVVIIDMREEPSTLTYYKVKEGALISELVYGINQWYKSSRIYDSKGFKNFGDRPVPFKLVLHGTNMVEIPGANSIGWTNIPATYNIGEKSYNARGVLNTRTGVVVQEFYDNDNKIWKPTGNILNEYVTGDLTTKIPVNKSVNGAEFTCLYI